MAVAISFFAGAGGLDTGLHQAGFDFRLVLELEETFCQTLKSNYKDLNVKQGDIMHYDRSRIYREANLNEDSEIDLMVGGSPCQSFSTAGKRQAFDDPRGKAMLKFAELVREVKPKFFLLENVRGLLSAALKHRPLHLRGDDHPQLEPDELPGSALKYLLEQFKGYNVEYKLLNSADYGVPQTRERVFFVGVREDLKSRFVFPKKTHDAEGKEGLQPWIKVGRILEEMKGVEHHFPEYSPERLFFMKMIPRGGGNWRDLPSDLIEKAMGGAYKSGGGKVGFFRRISVNKPAPTLLTSPMQKSTNIGHPFEDRPLSIEEYLAIQEFPPGYLVKGTLAQQYVQIGNAVPIRLAKILGESIMELINRVDAAGHDREILKSSNKVAVTAVSK